jgi:arginine exporter protein ArgO
LQAGAGAASADLLYAAVAAIGGTLLQSLLMPLAETFRILGGVALIGLGLWGLRQLFSIRQPSEISRKDVGPGGQIYLTFLGLTLLNPLTIIYFSALILGDIQTERSVLNRIVFVLGAGLASLSWQWLLAAFGAFAGRKLPARANQLLSIMGNLVVILLGMRLLI